MPQLKSPDCDCPGAFSFSDSAGGVGGDADPSYSYGFTVPTGKTATLNVSVDNLASDYGFDVYVDGALVISAACGDGSFGYSATLAAGAHTVDVYVSDCGGGVGLGSGWYVAVAADEDRC